MSFKTAFWLLVVFFVADKFRTQAKINHIYIESKKADSINKYEFKKNINIVKKTNDSLCKYWDEKSWAQ